MYFEQLLLKLSWPAEVNSAFSAPGSLCKVSREGRVWGVDVAAYGLRAAGLSALGVGHKLFTWLTN